MSDFSFEKRATREAVDAGCTDVQVVPGTLRPDDVEAEIPARQAIEERLRDDPQQERWMIVAFHGGAAIIGGEPTPVCHIQGPQTSSHGVEVVPLFDLAEALRERDAARQDFRHAMEGQESWKQTAGRAEEAIADLQVIIGKVPPEQLGRIMQAIKAEDDE